ncbi:beta-1,3-glucosyltransferase [Microplitis demolitor]|uniref:beta-1,3-glucosyltransferase n=1 Tax=Microplitis demolitor TaxID=69319 RepID=UPI0004CDD132|nr:beta-1,3-glucosyltransferase [Microplitis demolitor]
MYTKFSHSKLKMFLTLCLLFLIASSLSLESSDIVITILSQQSGYHIAHAELLKNEIFKDAEALDQKPPEVILIHEEQINGSWTFFPLVLRLSSSFPEAKWFFFCLENTAIKLPILLNVLSNFNVSDNHWISHVLYDEEPTIIHHFADHTKKFKYPNIASGFAMTNSLLHNLNNRIHTEGLPDIDFTIDAAYEFSTYIYNNGKGTRLTHSPEFCIFFMENCATYPKGFHSCTNSVSQDEIYVAVKTYDKNHNDRVPIILKTWLKHVRNFGLYSNVEDRSLPHVIVVPDTKEGHCEKTYAILKHANNLLKKKGFNWLIVTDDDTILSIARLSRLLSCYNPKEPISIGERYGYRVVKNIGYDYLTSGAGLALSSPLVEKIINTRNCKCPKASTPDDMFLFGICLNRIGGKMIHSPLFHQARPLDYAKNYLASQEPVSFHKFWMINPIEVYDQWFSDIDSTLESTWKHTEL